MSIREQDHQPHEDQLLLQQIIQRDARALQSVVDRFGERIFRYGLRLTGDESIAEEVANDVLLEVWRSAEDFERRAKLSTWILGITRYVALNAIRRKRIETVGSSEVPEVEDESYDIQADVLSRERQRLNAELMAVIRQMSVEHRDVLELTFYHGCSYTEIAEIVNCPVSTVRTRMFYARQVLRKAMAAKHGSENMEQLNI
jgi:RNA polymerase sigma-70 factor (ECF subfamily)